jgi:hypothetical protein
MDISSSIRQGARQESRQRRITIPDLRFDIPSNNFFPSQPSIPKVPAKTPPAAFRFDDIQLFKRSKGKSLFNIPRSYRYISSIEAGQFNIRGPKLGRITGLELRPLLVR